VVLLANEGIDNNGPVHTYGGFTVRCGTICGYITVYASRDGNHLSLFLNMKKMGDLPKDSGNLIEFTLPIKDQNTDKHHKITGLAK
jgi:hypothetical protein